MVDKMMRVAGRNQAGLAVPVNLSDKGNILSEPAVKTLMNETSSASGRAIAAGVTWTSETFNANGYNIVHFHSAINLNYNYKIEIEEVVVGATTKTIRTHIFGEPPYNIAVEGAIEIDSPTFRVKITNLDVTNSLNVGLFLFLTNNRNYGYSRNRHLMVEPLSANGRSVAIGGMWESAVFETKKLSYLAFKTSLSVQAMHSIELVELVDSKQRFEIGRKPIGPQIGAAGMNGMIEVNAPLFKVVVKNLDTKIFNIGVSLSILDSELRKPESVSRTLMDIASATKIAIAPNSEWVSPPLKTFGLKNFTFLTSLSNDPAKQGTFQVLLTPSRKDLVTREFETVVLPERDVVVNATGTVAMIADYVGLVLKNTSANTIEIGINLSASN